VFAEDDGGRERKGRKGSDLVCANYETSYPPEFFGMIYLARFNLLYYS